MGTMSNTRKSAPWRMPQAIDPNSHSPRNRNVPMAMSSSARMTRTGRPDHHAHDDRQVTTRDGEFRLEQVDVGSDEAQCAEHGLGRPPRPPPDAA